MQGGTAALVPQGCKLVKFVLLVLCSFLVWLVMVGVISVPCVGGCLVVQTVLGTTFVVALVSYTLL